MKGTVGLGQIQALMRRYMEQDSVKQAIEASGATLEEALRSASIQMSIPIARIEYSVVEEGNPGLLGLGRKEWRIRASEIAKKGGADELFQKDDERGDEDQEVVLKDKDGEALVRLSAEGVLLKVTSPIGHGKRATEKQAIDRLHMRAVREFDQDRVSQVVKAADGEWIKVGSFISNPSCDATMFCEVLDYDMKAMATIMPPGPGGCDLSADSIIAMLKNNRIVFGIKQDVVRDLEDHPQYKVPVCVAEGEKPINGKDAYMQYFFESEQSKIKLRETSSGRVNFKELNLIKNVVANQPLGRKVPAEKGLPGKTVQGKLLPAKNGRDIPIPLGKNVHLDETKLTIFSDINGQVILSNGKVNVEEVYTVPGDVNLRTGNIMFLGTVIVNGNVEDGFAVKASGNIEVSGNVGKSDLEAEGDIIVHQGIAAKTGGRIHAGKSIWARYIENARVEAGENVVVSDGIINSTVDSNKKIICQGKRAAIVGGHLRAAEEINAKALGSAVSGTETILEVGFDPKSKEKQENLQVQVDQMKRQADEIDKNLVTLENMKKQKKVLPEDKEEFYQAQKARREDLGRELEEMGREIETIASYLSNLKVRGKVSASGKIYPGVKINIREYSYDVKNEQKGITFFLEGGLIRSTRYEAVDDTDIKKGPPDAYKTN